MTVSSQTNSATFLGNGVATAFPLPFRFFNNSDIFAYFIDASTGAATPMVIGADYTLTGAGEPEVNGNAVSVLTTTAPLPTGRGLYVERVMQQVQETDIVNQGEFFASTHEDVFDRLTMLIQQSNSNSQGAIRVAIGDPEPDRLPPAPQRANLLLSFDSGGNPIAVAPVSGSASDLALNLANDTDPLKGAALVGYKGRTVAERLGDVVSVKDFGAKGDGVADDTPAFAAAVSHVAGLDGGVIRVPSGTYKISNLQIPHNRVFIQGESSSSTVILNASASLPTITWGDGVTLFYGGGLSGIRFGSASGVTATTGQMAVRFRKLNQFSVTSVVCSQSPSQLNGGFSFEACSQFTINGCSVQNTKFDGVRFTDSLDFYVTDSRSDANASAGWVFDGSEGAYFKGCTSYDNGASAFYFGSTATAVRINKNMFFSSCIGDTSGGTNWSIFDLADSQFVACWGATQKSTAINPAANGFALAGQYCKSLFFTSCTAINNNSHGFLIFDSGSSAPNNIHLTSCQFGSTANGANGNGKSGAGFGLALSGAGVNNVRVISGSFSGNASGPYLNTSSGTENFVIGNPVGLKTLARGIVGIAAGSTTQVVSHGLDIAPLLTTITLTLTSNGAPGDTTSFWVSNVTATQFTINMNANTAGINFAWTARAPGI